MPKRLAALAEPEDWNYRHTPSEHHYPILFNYLHHTLTGSIRRAPGQAGGSILPPTLLCNARINGVPWPALSWSRSGTKALGSMPCVPLKGARRCPALARLLTWGRQCSDGELVSAAIVALIGIVAGGAIAALVQLRSSARSVRGAACLLRDELDLTLTYAESVLSARDRQRRNRAFSHVLWVDRRSLLAVVRIGSQ
jgi:hypothetical protein